MFDIRILSQEIGPSGEKPGLITIGDFSERFSFWLIGDCAADIEAQWRRELRRLVDNLDNTSSVALIHDPRFAWILYREESACYIHQVFDPEGLFVDHLAYRVTESEDGDPISEWETSVADIQNFLAHQQLEDYPNITEGSTKPVYRSCSRIDDLFADAGEVNC